MFVHIAHQQNLADQIKGLVEELPASQTRWRTLQAINRFEAVMWQPHTFEAEWNKIGSFTLAGNQIGYSGDDLLIDVQRLLVRYAAQCDPAAVFGTEDAAVYLGLSVPTIKHHIHIRGDLPGRLIGKTRVFTKTELDAFAASERKTGRPRKQQA